MRSFLKTSLVCVFSCLLSGCLEVKDFGQYWDQAVYDACTADIVLKDLEPSNPGHADPKDVWRVLDLGQYHFLLMKTKPEDKGGDLIRIDVVNGEFIIYGFQEEMQAEFEQAYPNSGVAIDKTGMGVTASIPLLDEEKAILLQQIAAQDNYWEQSERKPYNPKQRNDCRYK